MKINRIVLISILASICLFEAIAFSSCSTTPVVKEGDTVQVDYTLTLADGSLVETSVGDQPLDVVLGKGDYLPDFEKAIAGMKVGDSKTITILAANAYGEHRDDLVFTINRSQLAEDVQPKIGDQLSTTNANGQTSYVAVTAVTDTTVTIDANAPLAGKDLTFKIDLLKIN